MVWLNLIPISKEKTDHSISLLTQRLSNLLLAGGVEQRALPMDLDRKATQCLANKTTEDKFRYKQTSGFERAEGSDSSVKTPPSKLLG